MKSVKFIDLLKEKMSLKNDAAVAQHLGWGSGKISQYRTGTRVMDDEACLAVAMALEIDPIQVVGAACIDRAEKAGQPSLWTVFMERAAATAATVAFATTVNLFLTPGDANAANMRVAEQASTGNINYAKLTVRCRCEVIRAPSVQICSWTTRYRCPVIAAIFSSSASLIGQF